MLTLTRPCKDTVRRQPSVSQRKGSWLRETKSANSLSLDFQSPEWQDNKFLLLSHPVCGILLLQPQKTINKSQSGGIQFPDQGWKHRVLATGPPGKSSFLLCISHLDAYFFSHPSSLFLPFLLLLLNLFLSSYTNPCK